MYVIFLLVSFGACVIGAICGIGGGVIIKPVLDSFGLLSVSAISFLSGCTVLSMTCYSVIKSRLSGNSLIEMRSGSILAVGAAVGGLAGKELFDRISLLFPDQNMVGAVQAACLMLITVWTLICTIRKDRLHTCIVTHPAPIFLIGLVLGIFSSFLGIGGGPINLVVLFIFFSMDTKTAAENSLYIILFSQTASTLKTILQGKVPDFQLPLFIGMVICGILGGIVGRRINSRIDEKRVQKLFIGIMVVIILINIYNICKYTIL